MKNEVIIETNVIAEAFKVEGGLENLFNSLKSQSDGVVFDMSDKKSRDECASLAYKISRSKTAVDDYGKELVADIKAKVKVIDNKRKQWRDACDALRDEIRAPLDAYEAQLKAEKDALKDKVNQITAHLNIQYETPELVQVAIDILKANKITEEEYGEFEGEAKLAKYETLEQLEVIKVQVAERLEAKKRYEQDLIARATQAAEQRAKEAELRAQQAEERAFKEIEAQQKAREADTEHKRAVNRAILDSLCEWGALDEDQGKELIKKIHKGEIPNLKIQY